MARCTNCNYKWSFKDVMAAGFSKDGKLCPNCGEKQYVSKTTQNIISLGSISFVLAIIFPFFIKLSDKNDGYTLYK